MDAGECGDGSVWPDQAMCFDIDERSKEKERITRSSRQTHTALYQSPVCDARVRYSWLYVRHGFLLGPSYNPDVDPASADLEAAKSFKSNSFGER